MEFKVVTAPFPAWDSFCTRYSTLLFHREKWHEVLQGGLQYPFMYCTLWEGKDLVLGLPVFLVDYKVIKILYASIPYGTIIGDYKALPHFLPALYDFLRVQRLHLLHIGGSYPGFPPLNLSGYTPTCQPIHLLLLRGTSVEELWKSYKSSTRRGVRKAERLGVRVEKIRDRREVEDFYLLYLYSMKRNRAVAKYPKKFIYSIYDLIVATGQGDIFFAKVAGEKVAGIMVLYSQDTAHYYFGGSRAEYHRYHPNEALFHKAIDKTIDIKKSVFDFMGSDSSDINLTRFKEKWGATSHQTVHYTITQNAFRNTLWHMGLRVLSSPSGAILTRLVQRFRSE